MQSAGSGTALAGGQERMGSLPSSEALGGGLGELGVAGTWGIIQGTRSCSFIFSVAWIRELWQRRGETLARGLWRKTPRTPRGSGQVTVTERG